MPHTTTWHNRGIHWEYGGVLTFQDVEDAGTEFYSDHRSDSVRYQIVDLTKVERVELSDNDLKYFAGLDAGESRSVPNVKVALITKNPQIKESCQRYIDISSRTKSSWTFAIFENIESSRNWIDEQ